MKLSETPANQPARDHYTFRLVVCAVIILVGISGFFALASLRKPPAEVRNGERPLKVKVLSVKAESIPVAITGYGQARTLDAVKISAEVAGQVVAIHPRLEVGEVIAGGELLFRIDPRSYAAAAAQSRAEVAQTTSVVTRLEKEAVIDARRLKTLERSRELAKAEFDRLHNLLAEHKVGSRSSVDRAEQAYNAATDQVDQMAQAVALYPIRIKEARSALAAARARLQQAAVNLSRCEVSAPFSGRLAMTAVEQGQYVSPGQTLMTLADDRILEIAIPLDGRDVRQWLRFSVSPDERRLAWFAHPEPVVCRIRWTGDDKQGQMWRGRLQRVVSYDQQTRTITVAVRVAAAEAAGEGGLPLVEGMFCAVEIPGRTLQRAYKVPRVAVSFKNTVFLADHQRLKTVAVQVARINGEEAYITGGLTDGDQVIVTRLVDPMENSLLEMVPSGSPDSGAG